jgi:hypothetical protein
MLSQASLSAAPLAHRPVQSTHRALERGKNCGVRRGWLPGPAAWGTGATSAQKASCRPSSDTANRTWSKQVGAAAAPPHRLALGQASADDPVGHRFDHGRRHALAPAVAHRVVDQAGSVGPSATLEFPKGGVQPYAREGPAGLVDLSLSSPASHGRLTPWFFPLL